ncbi:unnamed protein product, partial [Clonostachys solani]
MRTVVGSTDTGGTEVARGADVGSAVDGCFSRRRKIFRMSGITYDRGMTGRDTCQAQDGAKEKKRMSKKPEWRRAGLCYGMTSLQVKT